LPVGPRGLGVPVGSSWLKFDIPGGVYSNG